MNKPFAITLDLGSSLNNHTGSWRTVRPEYSDHLPPCNQACPAGENTQKWLGLAQEKKYREAWEEIVLNNPFPACMGRVCYHPCEDACNRNELEGTVSIHAVERFLGDRALNENWTVEPFQASSGKKVLVVGAGAGGLSAAWQLARLGHQVTVMESADKAGGMMRYGIPSYRLPRKILDAEIHRIQSMGVEIQTKSKVDDIQTALQSKQYDAVCLAIGAHRARLVGIPGAPEEKVLDAVQYLRALEDGNPESVVGKHVAVYGGGNTAIDVARSSLRLGASQVSIVYRGPKNKMVAHDFEIHEAEEEGIQIHTLRTFKKFENGVWVMDIREVTESGHEATGQTETFVADLVVMALGQEAELEFLLSTPGVESRDGRVLVDAAMRTGQSNIFAVGDMIPGPRSVTTAIGHGKKAAKAIDAFLNGLDWKPNSKPSLATADALNAHYYPEVKAHAQPVLDPLVRAKNFDEVMGDLTEVQALAEARRCLSCGNCFECDNCYTVCPDNAVMKLGPGNRFEFKYDYCKGCGICVEECPCGAIDMVQELI